MEQDWKKKNGETTKGSKNGIRERVELDTHNDEAERRESFDSLFVKGN